MYNFGPILWWLGDTRRTGNRCRCRHPGTTDDRWPGGVRGQDTGGQDSRRAETGPRPGGAWQDQPVGAGPGQEAAADHRRRVRAHQHGAGWWRQAVEPDCRPSVDDGQGIRRRYRQTGTGRPRIPKENRWNRYYIYVTSIQPFLATPEPPLTRSPRSKSHILLYMI